MRGLDFLEISFIDVTDIILVAVLLYYLYKLVKGTVAINIFLGIVIIYLIWVLTDALNMDVLSNILGKFISVGFFALDRSISNKKYENFFCFLVQQITRVEEVWFDILIS